MISLVNYYEQTIKIYTDQPIQGCRGAGFGIGINPCSDNPDTKTRPYLRLSDTVQSMFRALPIPKHVRTLLGVSDTVQSMHRDLTIHALDVEVDV